MSLFGDVHVETSRILLPSQEAEETETIRVFLLVDSSKILGTQNHKTVV